MKLKKVQVTDYKSIRDSREFEIGDITCLVGKNESGKTSLLEALYRLNPIIPTHGDFNVTDDYPRSTVEDYRQDVESKKKPHATVVRAEFVLDDKDLTDVKAKFGNPLKNATLRLSKGYENKLNYSMDVDEAAAVQGLVASFQIPGDIATGAKGKATLADLDIFLREKSVEQKQAHEKATTTANTLTDAGEKAKALDQANQLAESEAAKSLRAFLEEIKKTDLPSFLWEKYFKDHVPKFLYFDEYYQMTGEVNIGKLQEREKAGKLLSSDYPMLGLIGLSRLKIEELLEPNRTMDLVNKIEGASNHLSKQVLKYWSQNQHIRIKFDVRAARPGDPEEMKTGTNLWGFVYDDVHEVSTNLGRRSRGFVWFFSFLAWYSLQKRDNKSMILLLDEPGLFLHASAQGDFLKYMEQELLKQEHQIALTTHSPFMIDPKHFGRVRIVEDKSMVSDVELPLEKQGTKVTSDVLEVDDATLFPLQGALGYEISQTLFIGPNSLIVEGASDLLYIQAMSAVLQKLGRTSLRKEWTITPVGGADKVPTFAALIGTQRGMNVATLIDFQKSHKQSIENLYKRNLLKQSHVLTFADFTGTAEADIEDMFEPAFYLQLVSTEYAAQITTPILATDLPPGGPRILPRIETVVAARSPGLHFDHYRPSSYFVSNMGTLTANLSAATLDRFEKIFVTLNGLLPVVK